eukprot:g4023.t1
MVRETECACGAVKVKIYREPFWVLNCHCKTCRKFLREETTYKDAHYNGYSMFWFPDLKVEGDIFWKKSFSVSRGACRKCRQVVATKGNTIFKLLKFLHPAVSGHAPTDNIYYTYGTDEGRAATNHLTSWGWPKWATLDIPSYGDCGSLYAIGKHAVWDMCKCGCCCWHDCGRKAMPRESVPGQMMLEVAQAAGVKPDTVLERRPDEKGGLKVVPMKPSVILPGAAADAIKADADAQPAPRPMGMERVKRVMVRETECACGAVKVKIYREPFWVLNCHCKTCRKFLREETTYKDAHYNGYSMFWFPDLKVEGDIFWKKSFSVSRGACRKCRQVVATKGNTIFKLLKFLHPAVSGHAPTDNIYYTYGTDEGRAATNHLTSWGWPKWATLDIPSYGDCGSLYAIGKHAVWDMCKCGCCCWHDCGRKAMPRESVPGQMMLEVAQAAGVKPDTVLERRPDEKGGLE